MMSKLLIMLIMLTTSTEAEAGAETEMAAVVSPSYLKRLFATRNCVNQ